MEQNINHLAHQIVLDHISSESICLDATCGNGHDTVFLANHAKYVYAIDIQSQAIDATSNRLQQDHINNVTLLLGSHDQLVQLVPPEVHFDIVMYNLGYLPRSNHHIMTTGESTVSSLIQALDRLNQGGLIVLTVYTGHPGGDEEANMIEAYLISLDKHQYVIQKLSYLNRHNCPYIIAIQKT